MEVNPYKAPEATPHETTRSSQWRLWVWAVSSILASVLALVLFGLYGHWHWYPGPWAETLPGQLGLTWIVAVNGAKTCSALLALFSLCVTVALFGRRAYLQGCISLPACVLSLATVAIQT